jgi:hypothetical protein
MSAEKAIGVILAVLFSSGTLVLATGVWRALGGLRWAVGAAGGSAIGIVVLILRARHSRVPDIYRYDYPPETFKYEVLSKTIRYEVSEAGELQYSKKIRIRALTDQLEEYVDRYAWTGVQDVDEPVSASHEVKITQTDYRTGTPNFFKVTFAKSLAEGEEREFEIRWPPITGWRSSRPFVSTSTNEPTHLLRLQLQIPPHAVSGTASKETARAVESIQPFTTERTTFDENGSLSWEIRRPKLYHHFRVRWTWSGAGEPDRGL